jgi:hypothetical protein
VAHCADVGNAAPGGRRAKYAVGGVVVVGVDVLDVDGVVVVDVLVEEDVVVVGATVVVVVGGRVVVGGGVAESTRIVAALLFQCDSRPHPELKMPTFTT